MEKYLYYIRRCTSMFLDGGLILLYHRIAKSKSDPNALNVSPENFSEHLSVLRKHAFPLHLKTFVELMNCGRLPRRAVAVTFDDGYTDNLYCAKRILKEHDIPATVFAVTGHINNRKEYWWDTLDRIFLRPGHLPEALHVTIAGSSHQWHLGSSTNYSKTDYDRNQRWNIYSQAAPTARHSIIRHLFSLLRPLPPEAREDTVNTIREWARPHIDNHYQEYSSINRDELALLDGDLMDIGSHTVNHPVLAEISLAQQEQEIRKSKQYLEEALGRPIESFAYPHGNSGDFTKDTMKLVSDAGYRYACTGISSTAHRHCNAFRLPRLLIRDCGGEEFLRTLNKWLRN